ncbi:disulfide bond formation protein B [Pseudomonas sp. NPDC078700]|uniref:disulfide bond formation protein B n=1 Tax=Pseudomonas sp. NPDC078700 TaxID=3364424 RepID=UPI0037C9B99A
MTATRTISSWHLLLGAWALALAATLGALFIGEVMGQTPCNLCWFQRVFMFPLVIILGVACYRSDTAVWRYALPVATLGWLVALYHSLVYFGVFGDSIQPCGAGGSCSGSNMTILGGIALPALSLIVFSLICTLVLILSRRSTQ